MYKSKSKSNMWVTIRGRKKNNLPNQLPFCFCTRNKHSWFPLNLRRSGGYWLYISYIVVNWYQLIVIFLFRCIHLIRFQRMAWFRGYIVSLPNPRRAHGRRVKSLVDKQQSDANYLWIIGGKPIHTKGMSANVNICAVSVGENNGIVL